MDYMGRLRPKGVLFSGWRYITVGRGGGGGGFDELKYRKGKGILAFRYSKKPFKIPRST